MGKRALRLLLIIVLLVSVFSIIVNATENLTDGNSTEETVANGTETNDETLEPGQAIITIPSVNEETGANINLEVIAIEGSEIKYLLTNENGKAVYTGASEENFNIRFEYPIDGVPIITLKDAKLINGQGHAFRIGRVNAREEKDISYFPCLVVVESDSVISGTYNTPGQPGTYSGIVCDNRNTVTISGPGKLTVTSEGMFPIWMDGYDLILQDANVSAVSTIAMSAGVRPAIWVKNANIQINHSILEVSANSGPCIWISDSVSGISEQSGERYNIHIQDNSTVKVSNPNSKLAAIGCNNNIYILDSVVEVMAKAKCFTSAPIFANVGTIAGTDRLTAESYNPEKNDTYNYFMSVLEVKLPNEEDTGTEEIPDATGDPAAEETGTNESEMTEATVFESTEATLNTMDTSTPPITEVVTPTNPSETIAPQTTPVELDPPAPIANHNWIIFVAAGFVVVAAGVVWWLVIRKKMRK